MKQNIITTEQEKRTGMFTHLSSFLGWFFPFGNIIAPLIIWLANKDNEFIKRHGKAVLNFQISLYIYQAIGILILAIVFIANLESIYSIIEETDPNNITIEVFRGNIKYWLLSTFLYYFSLSIIGIVSTIVGSMRASKGEDYTYPITINFIR